VVLVAVFVCAACGLVYELELVALASYLVGDAVTQTSVVLSVMVFAMGVGSLLAKRMRHVAAAGFAAIEAALALVGGLSAMALYASFAWLGQSVPIVTGFAFTIGVLIGAEVPLLMTLIQRIRRQDAGGAVADLFAADYVGALAGGLAFPFLLLPAFGQLTAALLTGAVNAAAGGAMVLWLFRDDLPARSRAWLLAANLTVLAVLATAAAGAPMFEQAARHALYGADVRLAVRTPVQEIVLTREPGRLYLDGRRRTPGPDAAFVRPAMTGRTRHERVLILGGGDGLALREVLRHRDVRTVTVVDPDAELIRLARTDPGLAALNRHAYRDHRVRTVAEDPFDWLRGTRPGRGYDVVVADLPDARAAHAAKLYSAEFYRLVGRALADGGRLTVHAGASPDESPGGPGSPGARGASAGSARAFWTVDATLHAAGLRTAPYRAEGHGFLLAARGGPPPALSLPSGAYRLTRWGPEPPPSTLTHPRP
jgi:spermidine synthase